MSMPRRRRSIRRKWRRRTGRRSQRPPPADPVAVHLPAFRLISRSNRPRDRRTGGGEEDQERRDPLEQSGGVPTRTTAPSSPPRRLGRSSERRAPCPGAFLVAR